jgi:Flp pilus assembly protein TadD
MPSKNHGASFACMIAGIALLVAGCAMQSTRDSRPENASAPVPTTADAAEPRAVDAKPRAARDATADSGQDAEPSVEPSVDPIAEILAERRRSDNPEIELQDYGFTITEQVRVGSDARSDYEQALVLLRQARYAEGIAVLERVVESARDATVPYIDLGIAYGLSGDLERAESALETAIALSPDNPVVHNELGIIYRKSGRFDEARSSYEKALAVFADFHYARRNLAVLCDLYLADLQCALQNYTAYLDSVGGDSQVEIWIADVENRLASQGGI